jgi:SIR2-like domain
MIDSCTSLAFSLYENKGVYALLLGSGMSRSAQIPTGWEITLSLIERIAALQGVTGEPDWAAWYKRRFGTDANYSVLLDALSSTANERRSILHDFIEPTPEDIVAKRKTPTKAHRAVAKLVQEGFIRVIVTTNFDRLIENAIRDLGIEPTVVKSVDDLRGAVPLVHSKCFILKVHGDYLDTRILNTEAELDHYSSEIDALLDRIFDEYGLIICGWSAEWDMSLRAAIARAPSRRFPVYWASRGEPSPMANDLIAHRAGKVIPVADADSFFADIERMVLVQAELQRPNPRSTQLLVASAKKYLSKPEYRINLEELVGGEVREFTELTRSRPLKLQGAWPGVNFPPTIAAYEARTEPLSRVFGILGRWGERSEFEKALNIIGAFAQPKLLDGETKALALREYPAVLLAYALGLGALSAGKYPEVYRIFAIPVLDPYQGKDRAFVEQLFLDAWEASDRGAWNLLAEHKDRKLKTPLSAHLRSLFKDWTKDYVFLENNYTRLFDEFEYLGSLAFMTVKYTKAMIQKELTNPSFPGQNFLHAPIGEFAWSRTDSVLDQVIKKNNIQGLLSAGFSKGDSEEFGYSNQSIANYISRARIYDY